MAAPIGLGELVLLGTMTPLAVAKLTSDPAIGTAVAVATEWPTPSAAYPFMFELPTITCGSFWIVPLSSVPSRNRPRWAL